MINSPENPVKLPEAVKKEVEKVRQQLVVSGLELENMRKVRFNEENKIKNLLAEIEDHKSNSTKLEKEVFSLSEKKEILEKAVRELSASQSKLVNANDQLKIEIEEKRVSLADGFLELEIAKEGLKIQEQKMRGREEEFVVKNTRLVGFLSEIEKVVKKYAS